MKVLCQKCGKTFSAPDDWANTTVQCPKCHASVIARTAEQAAEAAAREAQEAKVAARTVKHAAASERGDELANLDESVDDDELSLAPLVERPKKQTISEPVPPANVPPAIKPPPKSRSRCPNCNAVMPPDGMLCTECGYHTVMKRVLQTELDDLAIDRTHGFERWMRSQLNEGESFTGLLVAFHLVLGVFALVVAYMFRPWGWTVLLGVVLLYSAALAWVIKSRVYLRWANQLWDLLLSLQRLVRWRSFQPPYRPANKFVSRSLEFGDDQLRSLESLGELEVLDLEGTSVTNDGLSALNGCQSLRYVVVRKTKVTAQGARRLQLMLPKAAIWV